MVFYPPKPRTASSTNPTDRHERARQRVSMILAAARNEAERQKRRDEVRSAPSSSSVSSQAHEQLAPATEPNPSVSPTQQQAFVEDAQSEHAIDCICSICECGRHRCPSTPYHTQYTPGMSSECRERFRSTSGRPAASCAPLREYRPSIGPFYGATTYNDDYMKHGSAMRAPAKSSRFIQDTGVSSIQTPFMGTSTCREAYPPHDHVNPSTSAAPALKHRFDRDVRDFATENRHAYVRRSLPQQKRKHVLHFPDSLPFQGTSTHHDDFQRIQQPCASESCRPDQYFDSKPDGRDFNTETRSQYVRKQLHPCPSAAVAIPFKSHPGHVHVYRVGEHSYSLAKPIGVNRK